jgi:ipoprotein LpqH
MPNRIAASTAAALAALVLGACGSGSQTATSGTASVTVNGNDTTIHIVKCSQVDWYRTIDIGGWYRTIDIGGDLAGVTVTIDERAQPLTTTSVRIRNVGGFTGMYSQGGDGDASMTLSGDKFTITGTANGYKTDKPGEPASAAFKISVTC